MFNKIILIILISLNLNAGIFDFLNLFIKSDPLLSESIDFNNKIILNKTFIVKKECSYPIKIVLKHNEGKMNKYKNELYSNKYLPIYLKLEISKLEDKEEKIISNIKVKPKLYGSALKNTYFTIFNHRYKEGNYKITLSKTDVNNTKLNKYDFELIISRSSKSNCN